MSEQNHTSLSGFSLLDNVIMPIKEQEQLYGDNTFKFYRDNQLDNAELLNIEKNENAGFINLDDNTNLQTQEKFSYVKDLATFIHDLPYQARYRLLLGTMNASRFLTNLAPVVTKNILTPDSPIQANIYSKAQQLDTFLKNQINQFEEGYKNNFQLATGRDPNTGSDLIAYVAQDFPYAYPIYNLLDKAGVPKTFSIPLSVGLGAGLAFDPKKDQSTLFFDSAAIKGLKDYFGALPNTPEGELYDRAYQTFETTSLTSLIGPIVKTAQFLKRNVPAFELQGVSVATAVSQGVEQALDNTINPVDENLNNPVDQNLNPEMQNQEPTILDNVKSGIDQFGNKLSEIGGAIKKEFSGEAQAAAPVVAKALTPVFKSTVIEAINKLPEKAPPAQMINTLKNIPGVSQSEIKWIGLDDFLNTRSSKKTIDKKELADFIEANRIDVSEKTLANREIKLPDNLRKRQEKLELDFQNDYRDEFGNIIPLRYDTYRVTKNFTGAARDAGFTENISFTDMEKIFLNLKQKFRTKISTENLDVPASDYRGVPINNENFLKDFYKNNNPKQIEIFKIVDNDFNNRIHTNREFGEELLESNRFSLERIDTFDTLQVQKYLIENEVRNLKANARNARFERFTEPGGSDYTEIILTVDQKSRGTELPVEVRTTQGKDVIKTGKTTMIYTSPRAHMGTRNEIAHARFKTRENKGLKILSVEELQSDLVNQMQGGEFIFKKTEMPQSYITNVNQKVDEQLELIDFPFKNTWHELVTRRLVRYAADNGFDAISFPKAIVSLRRYDKLDNIKGLYITRYRGKTGGKGSVAEIQLAYDKLDDEIYVGVDDLKKYGFDDKVISDVRNYINTGTIPDNKKLYRTDTTSYHDISAEESYDVVKFNLKNKIEVIPDDAKGRVEFYDKTVPSYLKKYAKKWNAPVYDDVFDLSGATAEQGRVRKDLPVVVLKLTPEMKKSVQDKSQPLFNVVLPALISGGAGKGISDNIQNNIISDPTKN